MKSYNKIISAILLFTAFCSFNTLRAEVNVSVYPSLSSMPSEDICALLASSRSVTYGKDFSKLVFSRQMPLELTSTDFITKVYGLFSPKMSCRELCDASGKVLSLKPEKDDMGLWLQTEDGYNISFYGINPPEVSTMARIENDSVADYGFFFMFPYNDSTKNEANSRQAEFCGALLQEMSDLGLVMGANELTDDLFDVYGEYNGNFVNVRLIDDPAFKGEGKFSGNSGKYIVMLTVEPNGFTPEDEIAAL